MYRCERRDSAAAGRTVAGVQKHEYSGIVFGCGAAGLWCAVALGQTVVGLVWSGVSQLAEWEMVLPSF